MILYRRNMLSHDCYLKVRIEQDYLSYEIIIQLDLRVAGLVRTGIKTKKALLAIRAGGT